MPTWHEKDAESIPKDDGHEYLSTPEAAEYLGLHPGTLAHYRSWDKGPSFMRCGERLVRYRKADLDHWLTYEDTRDRW